MLLTISSKINAMKEFMKAGDYDAAVEIADKINPERVGSVRDLMTVANAYLKKHRYEDAKLVYVEMYNHAATHKVLVGLIELCLKTNSPEEADEYIREFRKLEPENPERLIYRYRVDVMLGKGPEYLVRSLSKLKDEDYSDIWGLELAKAYYKMEDYQKCAQECKDILLWFSGTESAAKAHVLLGACAEKGVTISMPEIKPRRDEDFYDEEFTSDVPVIGEAPEPRYTAATAAENEADTKAAEAYTPEEPEEKSSEAVTSVEPVKEPAKLSVQDYFEPENDREEQVEEEPVTEDDLFFDVSAAIGEAVSETIAEDRGYNTSDDEPLFRIEDEDIEPAPESTETVAASPAYEIVEEAVQSEDVAPVALGAETVETAKMEIVEALEETSPEAEAPEEAEATEEAVPEDATELLTFLQYYREDETSEDTAEGDNAVDAATENAAAEDNVTKEATLEEAASDEALAEEEIPEDATVEIHLPSTVEEAEEEPAEEFEETAQIDLVALALKKAKESDDDEDIVLKDYFPELEASDEQGETMPVPIVETPEESAPAEELFAETEESSSEAEKLPEEEDTYGTPEVTEIVPEYEVSAEELFLKFDEVEPETTLFAETEEEDGQMSFFTRDRVAESVKLTFTPAESDDTFDISDSIAAAVAEEMENGTKEPEVSTEPTKVHGDLTAQALDAILREDDEAIEKALYGLLSDK